MEDSNNNHLDNEDRARAPSTSKLLTDEPLFSVEKSLSQERDRKLSYPQPMPNQTHLRPVRPHPARSPGLGRLKKSSMPVPILSLNSHDFGKPDEDEDDVTKRLETAVRRISRGSPNRSPLLDPKHSSGLSGLARGYEQYREWLTTLHPTTEFGEASSDDLSSEWESCSELDSFVPSRATLQVVRRPDTPAKEIVPDEKPVIRRPDIELQHCDEERDGDDEGEGSTKPKRNSVKRVRLVINHKRGKKHGVVRKKKCAKCAVR